MRVMTHRGPKTMSKKTIDGAYVNEVMETLTDLDEGENIDRPSLLAWHAQIGYWVAIADGAHDKARDDRKYAEADAMVAAKLNDPKKSAAIIEAEATKAAKALKDAESKAAMQAQKLRNLYETLGRALDGLGNQQ